MFEHSTQSAVAETAGILIHRPREAVFRFIGEQFFSNYPRWSPEVMVLEQLGSGPVGVGTQGRQIRIDSGRRSESRFTVSVFEPSRRLYLEGISFPFRCGWEIQEIVPRVSTLVGFSFELGWIDREIRPFEGLIRDAVREGIDRSLGNLKALVEAERALHHRRLATVPRSRETVNNEFRPVVLGGTLRGLAA